MKMGRRTSEQSPRYAVKLSLSNDTKAILATIAKGNLSEAVTILARNHKTSIKLIEDLK